MHQQRLGPDDRAALQLYQDLRRPVVRDLGLTPMVFDVARVRCSRTDARGLLDKLDLVHEELTPKRAKASDD